MHKDESELLKLLDQRYKALGLGTPGTYHKPFLAPSKLNEAVRLHGQAHPSDPFAMGRIRLHLKQGYELVSEVVKDAQRLIQARANAARAEVEEA